MLDKIKQFVSESFGRGINEKGMKHFERTIYWVKQLKPNADEPILIAAYAHDIARAFRKKNSEETFKDKEFNDSGILKEHQEEGAQIITEFLKREDYNENLINRVYNMIRYHEEGGDEESNLIKDADSISYLEINAIKHIKLVYIFGKDKIKNKIDWMYNRISSQKAKLLAGSYYKKAINFTAIYKKSGKWYLGWIEEIPGVNTQGKTLKETKENLKEALLLILETNRLINKKEFSLGKNVIRESLSVSLK